jgi:hypothetical protein
VSASWFVVFGGCLAGLLTALSTGEAQSPRRIVLPREALACSGCELRLEREAVLGLDSGRFVSYPISVAGDARRRTYVALQPPGDLVLVFDSAGKFIRRIGTKGRGIGQFQFPIWIAPGPNDSLKIFDFATASETVLDADWNPVRSQRGGTPTLVWRDDAMRTVTFAAAARQPGWVNLVHLAGDDGQPTASMHAVRETDSSAIRYLPRVAAGSRGTVWTASPTGYSVRQWDKRGTLIAEFTRRPSWLDRPMPMSDGIRGHAPSPRIWDIREDHAGRLWILSGVAANDWRQGLGEPVVQRGATYYDNTNRSKLFDSIIDVVDVASGRLLASQRIAGNLQFLLPDARIAAYRETDTGTRLIDLWRARFTTLKPE